MHWKGHYHYVPCCSMLSTDPGPRCSGSILSVKFLYATVFDHPASLPLFLLPLIFSAGVMSSSASPLFKCPLMSSCTSPLFNCPLMSSCASYLFKCLLMSVTSTCEFFMFVHRCPQHPCANYWCLLTDVFDFHMWNLGISSLSLTLMCEFCMFVHRCLQHQHVNFWCLWTDVSGIHMWILDVCSRMSSTSTCEHQGLS